MADKETPPGLETKRDKTTRIIVTGDMPVKVTHAPGPVKIEVRK